MDFMYTITLKGASGNIEFKPDASNSNSAITGVQFGFNSKNDSQDRDKNGRIEMKIYGKFDGRRETLTAIKSLAEWAKAKKDVYREITIVATTTDNDSQGDGNFSRTYHFDQMFCIDYFERTGKIDDKEVGLEFELYVAQAPTYKISETLSEIVND